MDSNSEEELRKQLELPKLRIDEFGVTLGCVGSVSPTRKALKAERDMSRNQCELPVAEARKKYNRKRAVIVFFGGVGLVFLLLLL